MQTPNLDVDKIEYDYYYNRLMKVNYPENPQNNIEYEYGDSGNETGRITKVFSNGNIKRFSYGNLGEITEEITTFVRLSGETYSFAMQTQYDSWNRILSMTYPDGEVVHYDYNLGGDLIAVQGEKGGIHYNYIEDIQYDKYGNQVFVQNGNGSYSNYTYDQTTLRLTNLKTYDGNSNKILDLDYTYDDASNITAIENSANQVNGLGGDFSYSYNYDDLYRLIDAQGNFTDEYGFELSMNYSPSGNITQKFLNLTGITGGLEINKTNEFYYDYNQSQPHTISTISGYTGPHDPDSPRHTFYEIEWDENGNMIYFNDVHNEMERSLCWDEENRLTTVKDNNYLSQYTYDAGGERVWKLTGEVSRMTIDGREYFDIIDMNNPTLYANPYLVINNQEYTKHIYAGSKRIVSKLAVGLESSIVNPFEYVHEGEEGIEFGQIGDNLRDYLIENLSCAEVDYRNVNYNMNFEFFEEHYFIPAEEEEHDIYFYHTDHLGSSSWITYSDGSVTQHMQNLPFGKPFIDQRATSYDIRYKFTGKEMDTETGYQYFGARYYNSDISVWLSVDPMSDEYLSTSPYMYVLGNPIIFIDPNGMNHGDYYDSDWNYIGNDGKKDGKIYVLKDIYSIDWDNKDINYKGTLTSDQSENLRNISERRDFVTDNNDFSFSKNDRLHPDNFKNNHNPFSTPASDYKPSPLIKGPYDKSFQNLSYNTKQFAYDLDQSLDYTTNGGKIPGPLKFISDLNPLYNVPSTLSAISTGKDFFGIEYNKAQRFISKPLSLIIKIPKVGKSLKIDDPVSQHIFNTITNEATRSKKKN